MSKSRRVYLFYAKKNAINRIDCFFLKSCGDYSCIASKLATWGESQLMLQTYAAAFFVEFFLNKVPPEQKWNDTV